MSCFEMSFICVPSFESEWAVSAVEGRFTRMPTQMFLKYIIPCKENVNLLFCIMNVGELNFHTNCN